MDDLEERLAYTAEYGIFDANEAGKLATHREALDRIRTYREALEQIVRGQVMSVAAKTARQALEG